MLDLESTVNYGHGLLIKLQELKIPQSYQEFDQLVKANLSESDIQ